VGLRDRIRQFFQPLPPVYRQDLWELLNFGGRTYPLGLNQTIPGQKQEEPDGSYRSFVRAFETNGVLFALIAARLRLFTQIRFQWRRVHLGTPGALFGTAALSILERPSPNWNTADLLARMLLDVDLSGNFYGVRRAGNRISRLEPDWVSIVLNAPAEDIDAQVQGYIYHPGGRGSGKEPEALDVSEVAHFVDFPDPLARYRGMSWITPLVRELMADSAMIQHKNAYFENGATPNLLIKRSDTQGMSKEEWQAWVKLMEAGHSGARNAGRTLYLNEGADAKVLGSNLKELDYALTQGHGETRMASAAGVPPIVAGLSEGLAAATYSNYGQARRAFADLTMRALWGNAAQSLEVIVPAPKGAELWFDDDIPFLAEDAKDAAEIQQKKAETIVKFVNVGFTRKSAVAAVDADDRTLLEPDPDFVSVQVQPGASPLLLPSGQPADTAEPPPTNGKTPPKVPPKAPA
jgi:phage portal protein BeeE